MWVTEINLDVRLVKLWLNLRQPVSQTLTGEHTNHLPTRVHVPLTKRDDVKCRLKQWRN